LGRGAIFLRVETFFRVSALVLFKGATFAFRRPTVENERNFR